MNHSLDGMGGIGSSLSYVNKIFQKPYNFEITVLDAKEDVRKLVENGDYWGGIIINSDATDNLKRALYDKTLSGTPAITFITDSGIYLYIYIYIYIYLYTYV
jgi:hypothetical protein